MDENQDIEVGGQLTFKYFIGGSYRGYDVQIRVTKHDLLKMLSQIDELERSEQEQIERLLLRLRKNRREQVLQNAKHQETLAKRRDRDRKRRDEKQKKEDRP